MRDVDTPIRSTLEDAEDFGASRSAGKSDIEKALERTTAFAVLAFGSLGQLVLSIWLFNARELFVQPKLLQRTASDEETGGVSGGPVGETVSNAIALELVGVGSAEDLVAPEFGSNYLTDALAVGETDDEAVLGRVVFVLGLSDKTLASVVVGLTRAAAV